LLSGPFQTLVAWYIRDRKIQYAPWSFVSYCLFIPLYCMLKNVVAIIAIYDHILGNTEWVVTGRGVRNREVQPTPVRLTYAKQANR
jgi:hypothetical protein